MLGFWLGLRLAIYFPREEVKVNFLVLHYRDAQIETLHC